MFLTFFKINLVVLSVTSESITNVSVTYVTGGPVGLITFFFTMLFT